MISEDKSLLKPKLVPVEVPWKIAVSTPLLKLIVAEFAARTAEFIARFSHDEEKMVTVTFESARWFRVFPARSEGNVIDESAYDWGAVKLRPQTAEGVREWINNFNEQWRASGICPDPNMYEVLNSGWAESTEANSLGGYKHFLILGEEMYVEVLCKGWSWSASEKIDWSRESS